MAISWILGGAVGAAAAYSLRKMGVKHRGIEDYLDDARSRRWSAEAEAAVDREVAEINARLKREAASRTAEGADVRRRAAREAEQIKERLRRGARDEQRRYERQWSKERDPEYDDGPAPGGRRSRSRPRPEGRGGPPPPPPGPDNPFTTLGVPLDASEADVKTAYRRLAKGAHPDKNPGDPDAADRFRRINAAYKAAVEICKGRATDA